MPRKKNIESNKIVFLILDGWGIYESYDGNAIARAATPNFDKLVSEYPTTALSTAGNPGANNKLKTSCESGYYILGGSYTSESDKPGLIKTFLAEGKRVMIISESERYAQMAHYFCHGEISNEVNFTSIIISSPKLDSYHKSPELAINKVADSLTKAINHEEYDLIVASIANPDILAHTGDIAATIEAVEIVDKILKKIIKTALSRKYILMISSDHGNAEYMIDRQNGKPHLGHTENLAPLILVGPGYEGRNFGWPDAIGDDLSTIKASGHIADVAPTILKLAGIEISNNFKGRSLINI